MLHLCPLGEFVDGDVQEAVAPRFPRKWTQDVQSPDCEGPGERDSLEALRWLVDLLGVKLACLGSPHKLRGTVERCGLVEANAEGLAHEGTGRRVMTAVPTVDVSQ